MERRQRGHRRQSVFREFKLAQANLYTNIARDAARRLRTSARGRTRRRCRSPGETSTDCPRPAQACRRATPDRTGRIRRAPPSCNAESSRSTPPTNCSKTRRSAPHAGRRVRFQLLRDESGRARRLRQRQQRQTHYDSIVLEGGAGCHRDLCYKRKLHPRAPLVGVLDDLGRTTCSCDRPPAANAFKIVASYEVPVGIGPGSAPT